MKEQDKAFVLFMSRAAFGLRYIYWVIPVLLIPAAFVIYFTEGRNEAQFVSIIAFAIALTWILRWLMNYSIRTYSRGLAELAGSEARKQKTAVK